MCDDYVQVSLVAVVGRALNGALYLLAHVHSELLGDVKPLGERGWYRGGRWTVGDMCVGGAREQTNQRLNSVKQRTVGTAPHRTHAPLKATTGKKKTE